MIRYFEIIFLLKTLKKKIECENIGNNIFKVICRASSIDHYLSPVPPQRTSSNVMDSWIIFQLTLLEVMTLGWLATRRCILCTLATRLFHHPPTPIKIPLRVIIRPIQLVLINLPTAIRASRNVAARDFWIPHVAKATSLVSEMTRFTVPTVTRPVAIFRMWTTRSTIRIRWTTCSDPCRPRTTSTTR